MGVTSFVIKSNSSDRALAFIQPELDYFTAELRGFTATARLRVYAYNPRGDGGLVGLLERLAHSGRPWRGVERRESLEGEFSLAATCSTTGTVSFEVTMIDRLEEWRLSGCIYSDLGQLPAIATAAASFFEGVLAPDNGS